MIYVGQRSTTNLVGTLIPFFRFRFTDLCSDWSKRYFCDFRVFCSFKKSQTFHFAILLRRSIQIDNVSFKNIVSVFWYSTLISNALTLKPLSQESSFNVMQNQQHCSC